MNLRFTLLNSLRVSVLFSCALPLAVIAQTNAVQPIQNVVLVHGAWADGSSWSICWGMAEKQADSGAPNDTRSALRRAAETGPRNAAPQGFSFG